MKKRILSFLLCSVILVGLIPTAVFAEGTAAGTTDDPILISSAQELKDFANRVNNGETTLCAKLTADIVLNDGTFSDNESYTKGTSGKEAERWIPIGTEAKPYTGTFDGNGKTVMGLYVKDTESAGLFGYSGGTIQNFAVTGYVHGTKYAGGIVGYACGGSVTGCVNMCYVLAAGSEIYAGGIVGYLTAGPVVRNCANYGNISVDSTGDCYVGGIAGYMHTEISSCYNIGNITGTTWTYGIVGHGYGGAINNCRWLKGTAKDMARTHLDPDDNSIPKTKADFAGDAVLTVLQNGDANSPWTKTGYLDAVGMTVPLLNWQTADSHDHNTNGVMGGCTCGLLPMGKGTEDAPYEIRTADDLKAYRDLVNSDQLRYSKRVFCVKLMNDIILNDGTFDDDGNYTPGVSGNEAEEWDPIVGCPGTFDGNGYTIKGLYVNVSGVYGGLFSAIWEGTVQNLTVTGYVTSNTSAGGIVGNLEASGSITIKNCINYCTVSSERNHAGGIAGGAYSYSDTCIISDCINYGSVIGKNRAGGIVGSYTEYNESELILQRCMNAGHVESDSYSGGIAGVIYIKSSIIDCINTGDVIGKRSDACIGGIVGALLGSDDGDMTSCYSVGTFKTSEDADLGGLVGSIGDNYTLTVKNCYWLEGTAEDGVVGTPSQMTDTAAKTKTEFADGTVLELLKKNRTNSPWADECKYLAVADMTLPLFKGQGDSHDHDYKWKIDETRHWKECDCGLIEKYSKAAHSGTDDGNCTTAVKCICGMEITAAQSDHNFGEWKSNGDNTHTRKCQNEGCTVSETEKCSGGKATDTEKAICKVCGEKYGELSSNNQNTVSTSKTGDNSNITLWITMLIVSGSAAAVTGRVRRNKYT